MPTDVADDFRARRYDIFVSYKSEDGAAREVLVTGLEAAGYEVFWSGKLNHDDWKGELRDEINRSSMVICLWSAKAAASENVWAEASHAYGIKKLLSAPIEDISVVPDYFKDTNLHPFDGWADEARHRAQVEKILGTLQRITGGPRNKRKPKTPGVTNTLLAPPEFGDIPGAPDRLIGRESELAMLRDAWNSSAPSKVNAVVLHALGGAGKSALLRTFANDLLAADGGGAARIHGWSAYSQGSGEQKGADADGFISKALVDFGWQGDLLTDPVERARALVRLVQRERVLLLLDGLEPLQHTPSLDKKGRFKDKGLAELIRLLAGLNPGLVVLTTRQEVPELAGFGPVVINHELDRLSDAAGADLLVELGVTGRKRELEAAVQDVEGHALSVTLLGTYLAEVCNGSIQRRDQFKFADIMLSPQEQSELATDKTIIPAKRAAKVIRGYVERFEELAKEEAAGIGGELALLNLLGLFDRPADGPAVKALLAQHISGLTDGLFFDKPGLQPLSEAARAARLREAKSRLRKLRLLSKPNPKDPHELDAHPVVRAFFTGRLEEEAPEAAQASHNILYRHYATAAPDLPETLEAMQPLFHAVQHGVKAGWTQQAYDQVFGRRIRRGKEHYIFNMLGAFCPFITTCAHFFEAPWRTPRSELRPDNQAWLLGATAFALTALGRLSDSGEPWRASLEAYVASNDWSNAARAGVNLSDSLLTLGCVVEAVRVAEQAVAHADRSADEQQREITRTSLAAVLTAASDLDRGAILFADAEAIRSSRQPNVKTLPSLQGYQYGDLILARGDAAQALARGRSQLDIAKRYLGSEFGLHNIGCAHLLVGRAQDALKDHHAAESLDAAVTGFRKAGRANLLPVALLARAAHCRRRAAVGETGLIDAIRADLAEVEDITGEEMRLYLTDLALERVRFALDLPSAFATREAARADAEIQSTKAAQLIAATGYHRRDHELADLKARLAAA